VATSEIRTLLGIGNTPQKRFSRSGNSMRCAKLTVKP
jgi:hypothetical protein